MVTGVEEERGGGVGGVSDGSLPCRFAPLTMLGCGTAQVCRIRVCERLAESISWAAERWKEG